MPELNSLYREIILDHFKCPRGKKIIECPDVTFEGYNPVCGDEVKIAIKVQSGLIQDVAVHSRGCAISVAAGSMLAELLPGKSLAEVQKLGKAFEGLLKGEIDGFPEDFGDLESLEGVSRFPVRIKCAMLAWKTIQQAVGLLKEGALSKGSIAAKEMPTTEVSLGKLEAAKHNGANHAC